MYHGQMFAPLEHGRYVVSELIGEGAMGLVYRAFDRELGHDVALKTLRASLPDDIYNLKREFRSLLDLDHPNLVHLYDLVVGSNQCFFTMELIEGPRVDRWIRSDTAAAALSRRAAAALWQLAQGLSALHSAGKLHRDIKPSNVLVAHDQRIVLLDLGLVSHFLTDRSRRSQHGQLAGTLEYMAPEQGRGEVLTPAADWFAVGVILYEALTGRLPWSDPGGQHLIAHAPAQRPEHYAPGVPEPLSDLVMELLSRDPLARPTHSDVLERLGALDFERPSQVHAVGPRRKLELVGRSRELGLMRGAFDACATASHIVCVSGVSGIGKTALVERFADELEEREVATVFRSRCHYRELIPYKAIDGLIDQLSRHLVKLSPRELERNLPRNLPELARIFPVLERVRVYAPTLAHASTVRAGETNPYSPSTEAETRMQRAAFTCLRELLGRLAANQRVVLWVDDVQWSDLDSIRLLKALLRTASPILFVFSYRDGEPAPALKSLLSHLAENEPAERVHQVEVTPLDEDEIEVLASQLLDGSDWDDDVARRAAHSAQGSPFFLRELVRELVDRSPASYRSGERNVAELIRERVARLPPEARELLELISVAGCPIAEHIARQSSLQRDEALSLLRGQSLLRVAPIGGSRGLDVYHDKVREAINEGLSPDQRKALHSRLAHLLERLEDPDPHLLVHHFLMAEQPERAALAAEAAADRARNVLAFELEASLVERALGLGAWADERWQARARIAGALSNAGRGADAARAFAEAAAELEQSAPGDPRVDRLRLASAEHLLRSGFLERGLEAMCDVMRLAGLPYPKSTWGGLTWALANRPRLQFHKERRKKYLGRANSADDHELQMLWSAGVGLSGFFPMRAMEFQVRHAILAYKSGNAAHVARALSTEAVFLALEASEKSTREADALQLEAVRVSERAGDGAATVHVAMNSAAVAFFTGRPAQATEQAQRAIELCREHGGLGWEQVNTRMFSLSALGLLGEINELRERQAEAMEEARERDDQYALICYSVGLPSTAWLVDDEGDRLRAHAERARERIPATTPLHHLAVLSLAQADLYQDNLSHARELLTQNERLLRRSLNLRISFLRVETNYVLACVHAALANSSSGKEREREIKATVQELRRLRGERFEHAAHYADAIEASIASMRGEKELAIELLERAALGFTTRHLALHAAACRYQLAEQLGSEQHRPRANAWFDTNGVVRPARLCRTLVPIAS